MATADSVLKIAVAEDGYRESGSNHTKFGRAYGWDGVPWCAIFIWYCLTRANAPTAGKTASAPALATLYQRAGRFGKAPRKGAVVFFDLNRNGGIDHVGFCIARLADGRIKTCEGNTGDAVRIRYRSPSLIKGYGYPAYSGSSSNWMEAMMKKLPVLKKGASGEDVETLQGLLLARSHQEVTLTGKFDDKTLAAVRDLQKWGGTTADGIVGPKTWAVALRVHR